MNDTDTKELDIIDRLETMLAQLDKELDYQQKCKTKWGVKEKCQVNHDGPETQYYSGLKPN